MDVEAWAREQGIEVAGAADWTSVPGSDPRVDFGCLTSRTPRFVVRPATVDALAATLDALAEAELPYKLRGAAYSAGGQTLIEDGAVVDLTRLAGIVADDPAAGEITVLGGTTWLQLAAELRKTGRRPLVLSENYHMTVGGTVSTGGVGDASGVHGLILAGVVRVTVVTPDGQTRAARPGDPLFHCALGGAGLFGAIAEVTLRTVRRPPTVAARTLVWTSLDQFLADAAANADQRFYEVFLSGLGWGAEEPVIRTLAGNFAERTTPNDPALYELRPTAIQPAEVIDRFEVLRQAAYPWGPRRPALLITLPLPAAAAEVRAIADATRQQPLSRALPQLALTVFRPEPRFPLAPIPTAPHAVAVLLRLQADEAAFADSLLGPLRQIAERAIAAGGKPSLSSIDLGRADLARTLLGPILPEVIAVKNEIDPANLCNRGVLELQA